MKTFLLICDIENSAETNLTAELVCLEGIGETYSFGDNIHFIRSTLSDEDLASIIGSRTSVRSQFVVTEFEGRAVGRLLPSLWDFLKDQPAALPSAA